MANLDVPVVIGLLSLIATIDLAQFAITLRHERKISRLTTIEDQRRQAENHHG